MPRKSGLAALCFLLVSAHQLVADKSFDNTREERLASVGKLWITVKYFHPTLAVPGIDWDQALVSALPGIRRAQTREQYRAAVQKMLDALHDPVTRVLPEETAPPATPSGGDKFLKLDMSEDRTVVVSFATEFPKLDFMTAQREVGELAKAIDGAQGIVFDMRMRALNESYRGAAAFLLERSQVPSKLSSAAVTGPGERKRMHSGLAPASGGYGGYYSGFTIAAGRSYTPAPGSKDHSVVFLTDESSELPPFALAFQAAGRAAVFSEGTLTDRASGNPIRVPLGSGVHAAVRLSEIVFPDGSGGYEPSLIVSHDDAMEKALAQARSPRKFAAEKKLLPAIPVHQADRAYLESPYPALEYRLLAGFQIWGAFRYFFAYRDLMGEDWDTVLTEFIPKLEQASDARQYHLTVAEMVTHVHDSHAFVGSGELGSWFGLFPAPLQARMIEGKPVVTRLLHESASNAGVQVGDIIVKIDGEDVEARIQRYSKYLAASTPQSLHQQVMQRLLNGPDQSTAVLTLVGNDGKEREVKLTRSKEYGAKLRNWREGDVVRMLPGNIGYADLDRLTTAEVDAMFEKFRDTAAIVFDMRGYPNGTAWAIAPRLAEKKGVGAAQFFGPLSMSPELPAGDMQKGSVGYSFIQSIPVIDKWRYTGRTVMLIDERTISQAEHTGLFFEAANGTKFVGSPTTGANGDVTNFVVPGGITIGFSGHDVRHADGRQLQRVGLKPDVHVTPTIAGIRKGRDEVLEKALEYLSSADPKP